MYPDARTATRPKLASLLSNWYSGATLFTILLDGQGQIVSNGESMLFHEADERRYDCTCGKYIDECDFYRAAAQHMQLPDGAGWDRQLFVHVPSFSHRRVLGSFLGSWRYESALRHHVINVVPAFCSTRDRFLEAQLRFFDNAKKLAGAAVYLDGTKSIRRAQLFARDGRSDMKALHLIRDGRAYCASYAKYELPLGRTIADGVKAWLRYIEQVDRFSSAFPTVPVLTVRYEDLCRNTQATLHAVCRFLEIPYEDTQAKMAKGAHILGNAMRRTFDGVIVESTSWRQTLDRETQSMLTSLLRRQLERFGYL